MNMKSVGGHATISDPALKKSVDKLHGKEKIHCKRCKRDRAIEKSLIRIANKYLSGRTIKNIGTFENSFPNQTELNDLAFQMALGILKLIKPPVFERSICLQMGKCRNRLPSKPTDGTILRRKGER